MAEEAVAIALFCAPRARTFEDGVRLAVNHSGASAVTGVLAGQLLGVIHSARGIPARWLDPLELRSQIEALARDLWQHYDGTPVDEDGTPLTWDRYPGW